MATKKIIVIFGATGAQGGGLARAWLGKLLVLPATNLICSNSIGTLKKFVLKPVI